MKKKVLALVLGIALAIQPFSTVIAADVQNNTETSTVGESETNTEIPNEIETNEENQKSSDMVLEEGTDKKEIPAEEVEKDTDEPVIHRDTLTIDKTEVTVGDVIKISVKVTDDSGLERVIINFENLDNNNSISNKEMTYNGITGKYEYFLSITETMVAGHWRIDSIGARDISDNYNYEFPDYGEGGVWDFYVKNDNIDSEAPIIDAESLKINKREFVVGDEILISAKISDNVKVDRVRLVICKDSEIFGDSYNMVYNDNTGLFECTIKTDESWIGNKYIRTIHAYDTANNYSNNYWESYDDNAFFVVTKNGEVDYDCEVVDLKCTSGETTEYSYSYGINDSAAMRIFDSSIVGFVDQSRGISNTGYEIGGVFTPYKEGKTTVEIYSKITGNILKVYRIEVLPKEHFVCNEQEAKGTFLSSTKQNYAVLCDNQKMDANVTLVRASEIIIGSDVRGQYEYEYKVAFDESGDRKVSIVGDQDNKEITLNIHVNSHEYNEPVFTWNNDNTCTATYSCKNCNKTVEDQICKVTSTSTEATCTTEGKTVYTATISVDGIVYSDVHEVVIPALGHQADKWTVVKEPTCTVEGTEERTCAVCGENESRNIAALGHDLVETKVKPTCTEEGSVVSDCTRCDYSKKEMIPALGHQTADWTIVKEATCVEAGIKVKKCTLCDEILEERTIEKIDHSFKVDFEWSGFLECNAVVTCDGCDYNQKIKCTITTEVMKQPTVDEEGENRHTASADVEGTVYTDNKIEIVEKLEKPSLPYYDVNQGDWFYDNVAYVYNKKLMTGLNDTTFGPSNSLARAQFAIILHRMEGTPLIGAKDKFPDVEMGIWYADAVAWASDAGIVSGYSDGNFGPNDNINREQMAVMMYRYARHKGFDVSEKVNFDKFVDSANVNEFAREAMQWAVGTGIISGKSNGTQIDPQGNAVRAECATIIQRFLEYYK